MMQLIPEYNVGDRVVVDYRPYELACPKCGHIPCSNSAPYIEEATVGMVISKLRCQECHHQWPVSGFYGIEFDDDTQVGMPYTRLSLVEEEENA